MTSIPSTLENLKKHATKPLTQWLIHAAKRRSSITYGEAKHRLETEKGFDTIFPMMVGEPAGELMNRIQGIRRDCPLLNILLVRQDDRMPGDGAGPFMAKYLKDPRLASRGFRKRNLKRWREACNEIATVVYAFEDWEKIYRRVFRERLPAPAPAKSRDKDGIKHGREGEGRKHRSLRLWVKNNPGKIRRAYADFRTETEVVLDSADRVDVVCYGPYVTVAVEVKSSDSDDDDLRRGVFQCIKYRAVMQAMDMRAEAEIVALLVTQTNLPGDLKTLLRLHGIGHFRAPTHIGPVTRTKRRRPRRPRI